MIFNLPQFFSRRFERDDCKERMKGTPLIKVDNYKVTLHETVQWDDEVASWERANSIVRFLGLLDDETSGEDLLPFETATLCVSHDATTFEYLFVISFRLLHATEIHGRDINLILSRD